MNNLAYEGYYFIFDGISSKIYGLRLCAFESGDYRYPGGSSMSFETDKAPRSLKTKILGAFPSDVLNFDIEMFFEDDKNPTTLFQEHMIKSWLFGQLGYKRLCILNDELSDVYFNCVLNDPEDIKINGNNGFKCTVVCDSGGAWEFPRTKRYSPISGSTIIINNISGNNDYMYPTISFSSKGGSFSITNNTDNNRVFEFTNLVSDEVITVNGDTKAITSSQGISRIKNFNKNYFRLLRGANSIEFAGDINWIDITTQNFRRLGG